MSSQIYLLRLLREVVHKIGLSTMNYLQQSHNLVLNWLKILLNLLDKLKIHVEPEMQSKGYMMQSSKRFERNISNLI